MRMTILCITLAKETERREDIIRLWADKGELMFLYATEGKDCVPLEPAPDFRKLKPNELACTRSHNRAREMVNAWNKPCLIIEDDAVPCDGFSLPTLDLNTPILRIGWNRIKRWGGHAYMCNPDAGPLPMIDERYVADWGPWADHHTCLVSQSGAKSTINV